MHSYRNRGLCNLIKRHFLSHRQKKRIQKALEKFVLNFFSSIWTFFLFGFESSLCRSSKRYKFFYCCGYQIEKKGFFIAWEFTTFQAFILWSFSSLIVLSFKCQPCIEDSIKKYTWGHDEGMRESEFQGRKSIYIDISEKWRFLEGLFRQNWKCLH